MNEINAFIKIRFSFYSDYKNERKLYVDELIDTIILNENDITDNLIYYIQEALFADNLYEQEVVENLNFKNLIGTAEHFEGNFIYDDDFGNIDSNTARVITLRCISYKKEG